MRTKLFAAVLALCFCTACSVNVAPIATATGSINLEEQSITEVRDGVAFTVKLDEMSVAPYQMVDNVASFHVTIDNQTDQQVSFPSKRFLLKDGEGRQYRTVTPEYVREIVSKDTVYLIPYPYVGYYYLEDQDIMAQNNTFASSLSFYAEYHPQDIFTRALTEQPILKHSNAAGVVYFIADLARTDYVELQIFADESENLLLVKFPFAIEK